MKDEYGNEVTQLARPLPVEYLLVDLPAAFPVSAQYTFKSHLHSEVKRFPVENRIDIGETQVKQDRYRRDTGKHCAQCAQCD